MELGRNSARAGLTVEPFGPHPPSLTSTRTGGQDRLRDLQRSASGEGHGTDGVAREAREDPAALQHAGHPPPQDPSTLSTRDTPRRRIPAPAELPTVHGKLEQAH